MWARKKKATTNLKALPVVVNIVILQQAKKLCVQHFLLTGPGERDWKIEPPPAYFPFYWLFDRDLSKGLSQSPHTLVV